MGFQLVPKSVTMDDLERPNDVYFVSCHQTRSLLEPTTLN